MATHAHHSAVILTYHRVAEHKDEHFRKLVVSPENFKSQLTVVKKSCNPVLLSDLVRLCRAGRIPPRTVAITFDDGYADVFRWAAPLLREAEVPATVFVVSGAVESGAEFWWDEIARLADAASSTGESLNVEAGGHRFSWVVDRRLGAKGLVNTMHPVLAALTGDERNAVLDRLFEGLGLERAARDEHRPMTVAELRSLLEDGLFEVGAHTVSHPTLSKVDVAEQRREITESKAFLESQLGVRVSAFSYPFGDPDTFTADTVEIVDEAGFDLACTCLQGAVSNLSRAYELPRYTIYDVGEREFRDRLNALFWGPRSPTPQDGAGDTGDD